MMSAAQPVNSKRLAHPLAQRARVLARLSLNRDFEAAAARMLTQGGDNRIVLNTQGSNAYGFGPRPDPALLQFGSSTGSVISPLGFQAAVTLFRHLYGPAGSYHLEVERQRREVSQLCGAADVPGTELVFAASGTDVHLFAAHLAARGQPERLQAVMVEAGETGSGVPEALAALHFATQTSQGQSVQRGESLALLSMQAPLCVKLRHEDGSLRSQAEVDAEFAEHVARQVQADGRCLLVMTDVSKTGLLAPSLACATQLRAHYGERLSVLVDACQCRLSPGNLSGYLAQEFMVAITGSKFVGGPAFCGALLLPPGVAQRSQSVPLSALVDYSARSDWPPGWLPAKALAESANLGLLLRWEAALAEWRRFKALPDQVVHDFLQSWQQAVSQRIASDASFAALPVAALQRGQLGQAPGWDSVQSIFPFYVFKRSADGERQVLSLPEITLLYQQLRGAQGILGVMRPRFQLGQPVHCGQDAGLPMGALRLCSGARLVTESMAARQPVASAIEQAMQALDQVALLSQALR
ncbi:MAG: hypothetical protein FD135_2603 [Comamonadaceae bacterium]|nr:MAG: hypothetical protein FD135_2603 [Comamonadaceae bacterium]